MNDFDSRFPNPCEENIESLFKFMAVKEEARHETSHILRHGKLYTPTPTQLNDPFECQPHVLIGNSPADKQALRKHFIKLCRQNGMNKADAEHVASINMKQPDIIQKLRQSVHSAYSTARICSLTTHWDNPLLWAHYANSHTGFCLEFNAKKIPFSAALKVEYSENYPTFKIPRDSDMEALIPALIKAKDWSYENEYRIPVFLDSELIQHDETSLILRPDTLKAIHLGKNISEEHKTFILRELGAGPFNPIIYQCELSSTQFKIIRSVVNP